MGHTLPEKYVRCRAAEYEVIEHNSCTAIGKSTDITVTGLVNTYGVTNVSMDATPRGEAIQ